jgi:hypothetical protein
MLPCTSSIFAAISGWSWPCGLTKDASCSTAPARSTTPLTRWFQSSARMTSPDALPPTALTCVRTAVTVCCTGPRSASGMSWIGVSRKSTGLMGIGTKIGSCCGITWIGFWNSGSTTLGWMTSTCHSPGSTSRTTSVPSRNGLRSIS